jgi:arylsulfatase
MAYMMQVYAAFLAHTDYEIGRVLDAIRELGQEDNTLVIAILGDNGASPEGTQFGTFNELLSLNYIRPANSALVQQQHRADLGGPRSYNHYPIGWAWAMNSPFQWTKQVASHYGGTRNPLIISWPKRIKDANAIRTQWHHTIDIAPTLLECMGVQQPSVVNGVPQKPIEGVSMAYSFDAPSAPGRRQTQYFEMLGNRAIYHDGWVACTTPAILPWDVIIPPVDIIDGYAWELYHVAEDYSQSINLALLQPQKLKEMQSLFYSEAARYNVFPLDNRKAERLDVSIRPSLTYGRTEFTYHTSTKRITEGTAPDLKNRSFSITAEINVTNSVVNGVLATQGGFFGGWSLFVKNSTPTYCYNYCSLSNFVITASQPLTSGHHVIVLDFDYDGGGIGLGGRAILRINGQQAGEARISQTAGYRISLDETFDIGQDTGTPASEAYTVPFVFSDELQQVVITLKPVPAKDQAVIEKAALQGRIEKGLQD